MPEQEYDYANAGWNPITFRAAPLDDRATSSLMLALVSEPEANRARLTKHLGEQSASRIIDLMTAGQISGKYKEFTLLPDQAVATSGSGWQWILLLGLGEVSTIRRPYRIRDRVRSMAAIAARHFRRMHLLSFATADFTDFDVPVAEAAKLIAEGIHLGTYRFERYKSAQNVRYGDDQMVSTVTMLTESAPAGLDAAFAEGVNDAQSAHLARNLVNTPAMDLHPQSFAAYAVQAAASVEHLEVEVLDVADMERERLNMHLAVGKGSNNPPCVVVATYAPLGAEAGFDLALVGKGVTFDSGGYNLKPTGWIERMYGDMGGGAAVLGAIVNIARQKLPLNVAAIIPLAENMVSGNAMRPGDILRSRKGLTVEVLNTDAEGRLLLGDALTYACDRFAPRKLVDIATLTGSMRVALGNFVTGYFVHSEEPAHEEVLSDALMDAGRTTGEWLWRFPVDEDYRVQLSSDVADLENCETDSTAGGGAITAAIFLKQFVDFDVVESWAHLDIAATALMQRTLIYNKSPYQPKEGATGIGARLLSEYARALVRG